MLRTFGGFAIERDGTSLDDISAHRKALALLAILAAQGSTSREGLMALLWPESDSERARGSLKQAVHLLRRALDAPNVLLGTAELRLNPKCIESDVALFSRALEEGDIEKGVRLYRGSFLDGVYLEGTSEFERWLETRRSELARRYCGALEQLAQAADARGDWAAAAGWWRQLQNADPLNSRVAVNLMLALDTAGERAAALQHARIYETLVREEVGIPPDPAVIELAERLRAADAPSPPWREPTAPLAAAPPAHDEVDEVEHTAIASHEDAGGRAKVHRSSGAQLPALLAVGGVLVVAAAVAALLGTRERPVVEPSEKRAVRSTSVALPFPAAEPGSIAVLPFIDLSPERDQEYFTDGITEELIAALSKVQGLKVVARTSAFQFKQSNPDVREVGRRLGVAHILAGSIRKAGDRLRITAQLVSTENGFQLWSETYDRRLSDVFAVQEEISRAIAGALQVELATEGEVFRRDSPTRDVEAYESYLRGLYLLNRLQLPLAVAHFESAVERDPQFARAYAALAEAYTVPAAYSDGSSPADTRRKGIRAAEAALRIDPYLADAHSALGWLEMNGFRWNEADRELRRAIEIDPRAPRARFYYAVYLHRQGRLNDAFEQLGRARKLDPLSLPVNALYGSYLGDLGRTDDAIAHLQSTLELDPSFPIAHAVLGHIYLGIGRPRDAVREYERVAEIVPTSFYIGFLGHAYARAGRRADARRLLADLQARDERGEYVSPGAIGWILLGLNERDQGFRWLQQAARERDVFLTVYGVLPNEHLSAPFRDDPRWRRLRASVGLAS